MYLITRVDPISDGTNKKLTERDCRSRLARPNAQACTRVKPCGPGSDRAFGVSNYPCQSDLGQYKTKLTRDGIAETVSRDQILRRE